MKKITFLLMALSSLSLNIHASETLHFSTSDQCFTYESGANSILLRKKTHIKVCSLQGQITENLMQNSHLKNGGNDFFDLTSFQKLYLLSLVKKSQEILRTSVFPDGELPDEMTSVRYMVFKLWLRPLNLKMQTLVLTLKGTLYANQMLELEVLNVKIPHTTAHFFMALQGEVTLTDQTYYDEDEFTSVLQDGFSDVRVDKVYFSSAVKVGVIMPIKGKNKKRHIVVAPFIGVGGRKTPIEKNVQNDFTCGLSFELLF